MRLLHRVRNASHDHPDSTADTFDFGGVFLLGRIDGVIFVKLHRLPATYELYSAPMEDLDYVVAYLTHVDL
jgi:hypothetical protein